VPVVQPTSRPIARVARPAAESSTILAGCATTTEAVRRAIQNSQESLRALAKRYGINPKTVAKWKKRETVADLPTGPKEAKSTVLSIEDEAIIVAFRRHTLLPLDDCLYALQATIPHLTRRPCIAACNATASAACQRSTVQNQRRQSSKLRPAFGLLRRQRAGR
jgi:hypothetical protein